ncbi:MAG: hypothetical protein K0R28_2128 [Paenibacillus sp.]|nr:hypothetical protein [Paenibacillus sp.]
MAQDRINLLSIGYSIHHKPIHIASKNPPSTLILRLQVKGTCSAVIDGNLFEIESGDLIFSKPRKSYQLFIDPEPGHESADYYLFCEGNWITQWIAKGSFPDKIHIEVNDDILSLWRRLIYEKRNQHEDNSELIDYLLKVLCLTLERSVRQRINDASYTGVYLPYHIKRYIEKHATEQLTLKGIARQHGISVSSAAHLFKQAFSQSIIRYVVEVRLSIAAERILHTDLPMEEIAETTGFRSYPYFCRVFRSRFQMPPSIYRKNHRFIHSSARKP